MARLVSYGPATLKLYLTLVMMTKTPPHDLYRPTSSNRLAKILGYAREGKNVDSATRKMNRALRNLQNEELITVTPRTLRVPAIRVEHIPSDRKRYITLPLELWKNGWINVLSNVELATYVALRLNASGKEDSPAHVRGYERLEYGFSSEFWRRGAHELTERGIVDTSMDAPDDPEIVNRRRTIYTLRSHTIMESKPNSTR